MPHFVNPILKSKGDYPRDTYDFVMTHLQANFGGHPPSAAHVSGLPINHLADLKDFNVQLLQSEGFVGVKPMGMRSIQSILSSKSDDDEEGEETQNKHGETGEFSHANLFENLENFSKILFGIPFANRCEYSKDGAFPILIEISIDSKSFASFSIYYAPVNNWVMEHVEGIVNKFKTYKTEKEEAKISLLVKNTYGMTFKPFTLPNIETDLALNYGKEFLEHHDNIVNKLREESAGIFTFFGEPGVGKSCYIKHLTKIINREFIYIPNNLVSSMENPELISHLINKKNAVIILEDAEKVLLSRGPDNEGLVSTILNLSDGLLGSLLNISFIITYNNAKNIDIDTAIVRKGRLKYKYEFTKLTKEDAQAKIDALGHNYKATDDMRLTDIYNLDSNNNSAEDNRPLIGFK